MTVMTPFPDLPVTIEQNGPDGYTLTDTRTGKRVAYAIARPIAPDLLTGMTGVPWGWTRRLRLTRAAMPLAALQETFTLTPR